MSEKYNFNEMLKQLNKSKEIAKNMRKLLSKKDFASFIQKTIIKLYGQDFVKNHLKEKEKTTHKRNLSTKMVEEKYYKLLEDNPDLSKGECKRILSQELHTNIKNIEYHIYKK